MIDQEKIYNQPFSEDSEVCLRVLDHLNESFPLIVDKQQAWNDLYKLTNDKDNLVRYTAISTLGSVFPYIPDKRQGWNDFQRLIINESNVVRFYAAYALGSAFPHVPDKQEGWNGLIKLTNDTDWYVKMMAICTFDITFSHVPDKQQAWSDLHRLVTNEESDVRLEISKLIGSIFSQIPNKQQGWNDLITLTADQDNSVRTYATHSLGTVSIFKASLAETEEDYKNELEKAIEFFEKAGKQCSSNFKNPSQFCFPFYRSFHTIIFKEQTAKEIDKYLAEAKNAVKGSKNKELLFEAVENLAEALKRVQNVDDMDLQAMKGELNFYRMYCDRATELMKDTEDSAPYATATMRKGLPILNRNLKELIEEIQKKAKNIYKESQGTSTQEIASDVYREVQKWEIGNQEEMNWHVPNIVLVLKSKIPHVPENKGILHMIESMMDEKDLCKQYRTLSAVIGLIPTVNVVPEKSVKEGFENLQKDISKIDEKLEEMIVSLKLGPREELVISKGINIAGSGAQLVTTIPLVEIKYPEVNIDLEKIKKEGTKLSEFSQRFVDKIKGYLP